MIAATTLLLAGAPAGAQAPEPPDTDFVLGSGNGIATTVKAGPQTGGLQVAVTFGQALADFQGRVARASSRAIDLGVIQLALTAPGCFGAPSTLKPEDFPQDLDADSRDPESNAGKTAQENGTEPGSPLFATIGRKFVQAMGTPESRAVTTTAGFGIEGVLEVGTGVAEVVSRIVDDEAREVYASVDVASLELLDGAIRMGGLHWQSLHRTGKDAATEGSFSVASLTINGAPVPVPPGAAEAAAALAPVNALLLGTGLSIVPPTLNTDGGAAHITPLTIQLINSPLGQAVVAPLVTGGQGAREQFFNIYYDLFECGAPLGSVQGVGQIGRGAVLPSDIALSALTGTGGFLIELGGARALTEGQVFDDPFAVGDGLGDALDVGGDDLDVGGSADVLGASVGAGDLGAGLGSTSGATAPLAGDGDAASFTTAPFPNTVPGDRGGAALTIGLIALIVVACVAIADYFHMRRGHRVIPEIE